MLGYVGGLCTPPVDCIPFTVSLVIHLGDNGESMIANVWWNEQRQQLSFRDDGAYVLVIRSDPKSGAWWFWHTDLMRYTVGTSTCGRHIAVTAERITPEVFLDALRDKDFVKIPETDFWETESQWFRMNRPAMPDGTPIITPAVDTDAVALVDEFRDRLVGFLALRLGVEDMIHIHALTDNYIDAVAALNGPDQAPVRLTGEPPTKEKS